MSDLFIEGAQPNHVSLLCTKLGWKCRLRWYFPPVSHSLNRYFVTYSKQQNNFSEWDLSLMHWYSICPLDSNRMRDLSNIWLFGYWKSDRHRVSGPSAVGCTVKHRTAISFFSRAQNRNADPICKCCQNYGFAYQRFSRYGRSSPKVSFNSCSHSSLLSSDSTQTRI